MQRHNVLEVSGRHVEEAIAHGLAQLGLSRDEVTIEILSHGSRGLLGLGAERAQVRILYPDTEPDEARDEEEAGLQAVPEESGPSEVEEVVSVAQATTQELLSKMGVRAQAAARPTEEGEPLTLEIHGEDARRLLDSQGEALNALQYIARLIVSRELLRWATFFLDVGAYRQERATELRELARRIAERVALSRQPLALEPMPAHERRIIHIALRDHPLVISQSVGQGEHRRVTIVPRR